LLADDLDKVKENNSIFVPAGLQRRWKNTGILDFKILVIRDLAWHAVTDFRKLERL
jgi:mannose-6-phosphate isomerase-like protein (cupin superfamily)